MKKRNKQENTINLLELIPVQNIQWKKNEEDLIILLKPKFQNHFLQKHILPRLKKPHYRIKLDSVGSYIWKLCDGKHTVLDIGEALSKEFGEKIEPLYDRLSQFFQSMENNKFITLKGLN